MRISDWSSDVCSSELGEAEHEIDLVPGIAVKPCRAHHRSAAKQMLLDANIPAFRGFGIQQRVAIFALELVKRRRLEALAITRTHKGCAFIVRPCQVRQIDRANV